MYRGKLQTALDNFLELLAIVSNPPPVPPRVKLGRMIVGKTDFGLISKARSKLLATSAFGHSNADLLHRHTKQLTILSHTDRPRAWLRSTRHHISPAHRDRPSPKRSSKPSDHPSLATAHLASLGDDLLNRPPVNRFDIHSVGHIRIGHNRRRVTVHQDDTEAFRHATPYRLGHSE